jgi:hypothetical protein
VPSCFEATSLLHCRFNCAVKVFAVHGPYSQHFLFFLTYDWPPKARVLHYTRLQRAAIDKYFSLLGPFVSYKENAVLWIRLHAPLEVYL